MEDLNRQVPCPSSRKKMTKDLDKIYTSNGVPEVSETLFLLAVSKRFHPTTIIVSSPTLVCVRFPYTVPSSFHRQVPVV